MSGRYISQLGVAVLNDWESRSASAENPTGERGQGGRATIGTGAEPGRDLGQGWKVSPSLKVQSG